MAEGSARQGLCFEKMMKIKSFKRKREEGFSNIRWTQGYFSHGLIH
jgi:hypothetical protein